MYNTKKFLISFIIGVIVVLSLVAGILYQMNTKKEEDCKYGRMYCIQVKKTFLSDKLEQKECEKVYCRKNLPKVEPYNNKPYSN